MISSWDLHDFGFPPATQPAPEFACEGVSSLFFEGPSWRGKPTRVFAYLGRPEGQANVPGIVLVHGGLGTAFAGWVKQWNALGYAAIALDTCGSVPVVGDRGDIVPRRDEQGGPPGWGGLDQVDELETDQWAYHAVSNIVRAHSLLLAQPGVASAGVTGISWGGFLTCLVAGVDPRFRFAAPVYGCGFLRESPNWKEDFEKIGAKAEAWEGRWDPSHHLSRAKIPFLWLTGTNDFAFRLPSLQKSYHLPTGPRMLSITVRMEHSHPAGERPPEIPAFADSVMKQAEALPQITRSECDGQTLRIAYQSARPLAKAELVFTEDSVPWVERFWKTAPARLGPGANEASAPVPPSATAFYLNLIDQRGLVVSSEHIAR